MQEEIRRYGDRMRAQGQMPLQVRIGANTGEVVVRSLKTGAGQAEYTPIGHSTSLAARLQSLATPGSTVISGSTRRFVEDFFRLKDLGKTAVKGVSEPVELFEVTGLGPLRTRLQASARRGLTRFTGRDAELAQMRRVLELAREGHGQIVAAIGEAGVGKSRLFFEFKTVSETGCLVLDAYSVSHGKASAYLPVIELLREYSQIAAEDDEPRRREKIGGKVLMLDRSLEDTLPYIFSLMGIQEGSDPFAQMDPQVRRKRTQEAIKRILLGESLNQPLVIIFEDLHWIDSETQEFLNCMVDAIANARILLLVNYRLEYRHEWGNRTYYTQLRLDPLDRENTSEILATLLGGESELEPLRHLIAERKEGNPFFIEEIVQALFEQGTLGRNGTVKLTRPLTEVTVPATVRAVLASRIDRLPVDEKDLLQTLAVIGREFTLLLIQRVSDCSETELEHSLSDLQRGEFIHEQPTFPEVEYIFKHALTQEVAYNSLLSEHRKQLHERAGAAIESLYAGNLDDHIEELAHHYSRSNNPAKALQYPSAASEEAFKRSVYDEAIAHANAALGVLGRLPETSDSLQNELALQLRLGQAFAAVLGYGATEAGRAFDRALLLSRRIEDPATKAAVLGGLWEYHLVRSDHRAAYDLALELWQISAGEGGEQFLVDACVALGASLYWMGEFAESARTLQKGATSYRPGQRLLNIATSDTLCYLLEYLASCLWHLGYPDKAIEIRIQTLQRAGSIQDRYTTAQARAMLSFMRLNRRDEEAEEDGREAVAVSSAEGFTSMRLWGQAFYACAHLRAGLHQEISVLLDSMRELENVGSYNLPLVVHLRGHSLWPIWESSCRTSDNRREPQYDIEKSWERQPEAELHRVRGEMMLLQPVTRSENAEICFRKAIEIARRQGAKSWELRATISLSRLLAKHGSRDEARAMLAEIYGWFTEGFDTADLKDAKGAAGGVERVAR